MSIFTTLKNILIKRNSNKIVVNSEITHESIYSSYEYPPLEGAIDRDLSELLMAFFKELRRRIKPYTLGNHYYVKEVRVDFMDFINNYEVDYFHLFLCLLNYNPADNFFYVVFKELITNKEKEIKLFMPYASNIYKCIHDKDFEYFEKHLNKKYIKYCIETL